jgi:hypothetical protein
MGTGHQVIREIPPLKVVMGMSGKRLQEGRSSWFQVRQELWILNPEPGTCLPPRVLGVGGTRNLLARLGQAGNLELYSQASPLKQHDII